VTNASSDVDFDDYGVFGYQVEPEYTEEELRQMEEAASTQHREIENNPRQNDTNLISTYIHLDKVRKDHDHERYKQMKGSQKLKRLGHTRFTSCSSEFLLKTLSRASK
jgi:type II secretory pathway component PulC